MTGPTNEKFDEQAALAALERFRRDIDRHRAEREGIGRRFDRFIETLPAPEDVFPSEATVAPRPVEAKAAPIPETIALPPLPKRTAGPAATPPVRPPESVPAATVDDLVTTLPDAPLPAPRKNRTPAFAAVIAILFAVGAFATWTFRRAPEAAPPASAPAPVTAAAVPPAAPQPAPPPVVTGSEISTIRRAWVRVIADGQRIVEREVPANTRLPFTAEKTIVVRTGDAGAVKLAIRGEDQGPLGRDGEVVTKTFTVPAAPKR